MRKVLSFVLVLALVLGSFSMAFAATPAGGFSDTDAEAVSVLADLDVIDGYPDGTFKPGNVVTRAEMAKLIIVALGLQDFATATTSKYSDMAGAGWAQGYVAYATSLGIIEGYPGGTFGPSNPVTYNEACAMIVRALGYTAEFLPGEWPAEWVVKAQTLGILDGVTAAGATGATRGNIAEMLYNALELGIGYVNKDGDWVANAPQDTMLIRLGATFIAADDAKALTGAGFEADGVIYGDEDSTINLRPFVGAYADRYINDDKEIIKVVEVSTFLTGDYNYEEDLFEADNKIDYNISSDIANNDDEDPVFYNGLYDHMCDLDTHDTDVTIAVKVSGKTIKEVYSIAEWDITSDLLFDEDFADEIADDMTLDTEEFVLDDNDEIDLNSFELLGADSLDAIDKDNVVYIYSDDDNYIRKIEVGTETVTGKITKVSGDDYTIAGKVYTDAYYFIGDELALGDTGTAKLDYAGDIYDWDVDDATADNYAIVVATKWVTPSAFEDSQIKLITADGTETIYDVEDDAIATPSSIAANDLITFALNKDGNIDEIKECAWVAGTDPDKLNAARTIYNGKVLDSAVIVFTTDGSGGYDVAKISTVDTDKDLNAYYFAPGSKVEVLLVSENNADAGDTVYAVINDVSYALNADDDEVLYVEGYADGKAFAAYTDSDTMAIAAANTTPTIYELTLDADGVITDAMAYTATLTDLEFMASNVVDDKDGSYLVKFDGNWYSIDANVNVYQLTDADKEYSLKSITAVKTGVTVTMWQTDEDSEVYDLIIVEK